jgi:hypothetical protein
MGTTLGMLSDPKKARRRNCDESAGYDECMEDEAKGGILEK